MSVDDIRKMKQRQANQGLLPHAPRGLQAAQPAGTAGAAGAGLGRGLGGALGPFGVRGGSGTGAGGKAADAGGRLGAGAGAAFGLGGRGTAAGGVSERQARPLPVGAAQPPAAKRLAGAGAGGGTVPMPVAPPGMVLMEELQQVSAVVCIHVCLCA